MQALVRVQAYMIARIVVEIRAADHGTSKAHRNQCAAATASSTTPARGLKNELSKPSQRRPSSAPQLSARRSLAS